MGLLRRQWSIATRVSLVTLVSVGAAITLVSVLSLWGVNRLVAAEEESQIRVYRRLIVDDLASRLEIVDRSMTSIASDPETAAVPGGGAPLKQRFAESQYFQSVSLHARDGGVLATTSPISVPPPPSVTGQIASADIGVTRYTWVPDDADRGGTLWALRPYGPPDGRRAVVGLVDLAFLTRALDEPATWDGSLLAVLFDESGNVVAIVPRQSELDVPGIRYGAGETTGTASARLPHLGQVRGAWGRVALGSHIAWRVVVFDTGSGPLDRARAALTPARVGLIVIGLVAILASFAFSRRLVAPLRALERSAREVAAGGYVRPLDVRRDDELGRLADAFNDMGVRLNSLQDVARLLASADSTEDVLDACLNAVGHILSTGDVAVLLADEEETCLYLARGRGLAIPDATLTVWLDEPSVLVESYRAQKPVYFGGDGWSGTDVIHALFGVGSERRGVVVPLTAGAEALGVAVVLAAGRRILTDAQVETLAAFSANAAVAIRTSRLFGDEQKSRREAESLRAVAELTAPAQDLEEVLRAAGEIAAELLRFDAAHVIIEHREDLDLPEPADPEISALLQQAWGVARLWEGRNATDHDSVILTSEADIGRLAHEGGVEIPWGCMLFIPLVYEQSVSGALVLVNDCARRPPTQRERAVARSIGQQLALAMRNAHLLRTARSRATNLETVFRISQAVSSELQPGVVLNRVLDVVQKILSADAVSLMSFDEARGTLETSMARGVVSRGILSYRGVAGEDIPGEVIASRSPLLYGGLADRPTAFAGFAADEGLESLLAVPLLARGRAIGVLSVFSRKQDAFGADDMELLLTFASQAALAIDTAALYGREHHIASVLQQSILPDDLPVIPRIESASFYLPSGREAEIGGDYYDVFETPDGRLALVIADVCGKGVRAATKTSMVKYSVRGLVGAGLEPGSALRELNRQLFLAGDPSDIVTIWLGILDTETGRLIHASGGHPAGMLRREADHEIERLPATGPLLGAVRDAHIGEELTRLEAGDLLLLCTDGVTEARNGVRLFGEGRVRRVLRGCDGTASSCVSRLLQSVQEFGNSPLRDDAAALAVRFIADGT